jgi:hypothetical protein
MPETVLAIFGAWALASFTAGALLVMWVERRQKRSTGHRAPLRALRRRPAGEIDELELVVRDKRRHARR